MAGNKKGLFDRLRDIFGASRPMSPPPGGAGKPQPAPEENEPHGLARGHHKGTEAGPPGLRGRMPGEGHGHRK